MPSTESLPSESEFDPSPTEFEVVPPSNGHSPLPDPVGTMRRAVLRRRSMPDVNVIMADLFQLSLDNVAAEEVFALCAVYSKEVERVVKDGYVPRAGGLPVTGPSARARYGLEKIMEGIIALRDPEWRQSMRQEAEYTDADALKGEAAEEAPDGF